MVDRFRELSESYKTIIEFGYRKKTVLCQCTADQLFIEAQGCPLTNLDILLKLSSAFKINIGFSAMEGIASVIFRVF